MNVTSFIWKEYFLDMCKSIHMTYNDSQINLYDIQWFTNQSIWHTMTHKSIHMTMVHKSIHMTDIQWFTNQSIWHTLTFTKVISLVMSSLISKLEDMGVIRDSHWEPAAYVIIIVLYLVIQVWQVFCFLNKINWLNDDIYESDYI